MTSSTYWIQKNLKATLYTNVSKEVFNPSSANPTKWSNTLKQQPTNCLNVFDHFVGLVLKGLKFP